jgi:hypothetical protein
MKFKQIVVVTGIKRSVGEFEGRKYDSTKIYVQVDLDDSKGNAKGMATAEYGIGDSKEFEHYCHLPFPFNAEAEMEISSTGKSERVMVLSLKPIELVKQKAA